MMKVGNRSCLLVFENQGFMVYKIGETITIKVISSYYERERANHPPPFPRFFPHTEKETEEGFDFFVIGKGSCSNTGLFKTFILI